MGQQLNQFDKMTGSLEDRFDFLEAVAGTLSAKAYRAVDVSTRQEVTVWRTRGPLQSGEVSRFHDRIMSLQRIPRVEPILWCGVDNRNRGFAVLRAYDGRKIDCSATTKADIEERFDGCATILEALHERGITCGDICLDSFLLNDRGGVSLFAVLGDTALQHEDEDGDLRRSRYEAFRPPEQKRGGTQPAFVDVYALARIGEGLSALRVNEDGSESSPALPWIKKFLESRSAEELRKDPTSLRRMRLAREGQEDDRKADEDLRAIADLQEAAEAGAEKHRNGSKLEALEESEPLQGMKEPAGGGFTHQERPRASLKALVSPRRMGAAVADFAGLLRHPSRVLLLALGNLIALTVLFYSYVQGRAGATQLREQQVAEVVKQQEDKARVVALYQSQSPSAYEDLSKELSGVSDPVRRGEILRALTFRARRQGLGRTSDIVLDQIVDSKNLSTFGGDEQSRPFVRVLDPALPSGARLEELVRLYQVSPRLASSLAAASALDTGDAEPYRGLFAKAVAEQTGVSNAGEHNPYALMLLLPDVHDLFSEDIVMVQDRIPAADVVWLLDELGRQGRPEVSSVAQIAERRNIFPRANNVFLRELRRSAALKQRIRTSMVSGALGRLSIDDVNRFNEWYGQGAPRVLEAAILTTSDPSVKEAAFNGLSAKPTDDPYVAKVMEFVRASYGEDSPRYGGVVAALDLRTVVGEEALNREFDALRDAPRSKELFKQLVQGAPPEVIQIVLTRYGDSMDQLDIVDLLGHSAPQVRIAAVASLTQVNDIMLQKLISQSYDDETDPSVRAAYEEKISIVKERLS